MSPPPDPAPRALPAEDALAIFERVDQLRDRFPELEDLCVALAEYLRELLGAEQAGFFVLEEGDWAPVGEPPPALQAAAGALPKDAEWRVRGDRVVAFAMTPSGALLGAALLQGGARDAAALERARVFTVQADSALAQALAFRSLAERNAELEAIYVIDHIRDEHLDFDTMLDRVMLDLMRAVPARTVVVGLAQTNDAERTLRLRQAPGTPPLSTGDHAAVATFVNDAFHAKRLVRRDHVGTLLGGLCVPLILGDLIIGGLCVLGADFRRRDERIIEAIGSQVDTAIFEDLSRQRIKATFKRYVSDQVVEEMLRNDAEQYLRGKRRDVTVIFTDLRAFTTVAESLEVDVLVEMLNEHLAEMTDEVFRHGGTVDKFIGDCVMAFWGAPVAMPDHARRAVIACIALRRRQQALQRRWKERGLPAPAIGIGVNSGEVMVGNIGSDRLSSYTVIGDAVNLAARMEGLSGGDDILITEFTRAQLGEGFLVEPRGEETVKGKTVAVHTFHVVDGPSTPEAPIA